MKTPKEISHRRDLEKIILLCFIQLSPKMFFKKINKIYSEFWTPAFLLAIRFENYLIETQLKFPIGQCPIEKNSIIFKPNGARLSSRNKFTSKCRHATKLLISNGWTRTKCFTFRSSHCDLVHFESWSTFLLINLISV